MVDLAGYVGRLGDALGSLKADDLERAKALLFAMRSRGGTVWVCGNGASAANAGHCVAHLSERGFRTVDMAARTPSLTALSNDHGYAKAWLLMLRQAATRGDCLLAISASGDSPNVLAALAEARRIGMATLGLLGFGGGAALSLCDVAVVVRAAIYGPVEDAHSAVIHVLTDASPPSVFEAAP